MCGRYANSLTAAEVARHFGADRDPSLAGWEASDEVFPTTRQPIVVAGGGGRRLTLGRWGWRRDFAKRPLINARADKLVRSGLWSPALERHRCVVPATAWFEWTGPQGAKRRHRLSAGDGPIGFAGLWEGDGGDLAYTIVTCQAAAPIRHVHDRMPAVLAAEHLERWVDPGVEVAEALDALRVDGAMVARLAASPDGD